MEPEIQVPARREQPAAHAESIDGRLESKGGPARGPVAFLKHSRGLGACWSIAVFIVLFRIFNIIAGTFVVTVYPPAARFNFAPGPAFASELCPLLALLGAAAIVALIEHRSPLEFNLRGPRPAANFLIGLAAGFLTLSALVCSLALGGWLRFGPAALRGFPVVKYAFAWGCAFLLVGCFEEGTFRGFLQSTLTRGIHFWWALAMVAAICLDLGLRSQGRSGVLTFLWIEPLRPVTGNGMWGVYAVALLGLVPCALLHFNGAESSRFWQAAWVTSTLFGFVHTGNNGENWMGIFAAAAIGFVFCVSVFVTGSAWWAIGCHAAWDWSETFFYGTADSGFAAKGHLLTTVPAGNALWSGGSDGPEGSLLMLGAVLLLLALLAAIHRINRLRPAVD